MSREAERSSSESPATVELRVDGVDRTLDALDGSTLLGALREQLGLLGVRRGCGLGICGACTVLVDGEPERSCITRVDDVAGGCVETAGSLEAAEADESVRRPFIELQAAQCGYCLNGIMTTVAALRRRDEVTFDDLVAALDGNLCRCGTHPRILEAACRALDPSGDGAAVHRGREISTYRVERRPVTEEAVAAELPPLLADQPEVGQWLELRADDRVDLWCGRSELGQGVLTAMAQIVAAQLGVAVDRVVAHAASTDEGPDVGYTVGSKSMQEGATAVAMAAAALRRLLLARAASLLGTTPDALHVVPDGAVVGSDGRSVRFSQLRGSSGTVEVTDRPDWLAEPMGAAAPRADLVKKLSAAPAYVQDLQRPGLLHAVVVLPPTYDAPLRTVDVTGVRDRPGVVEVVRDGRLLMVIAESARVAEHAGAVLAGRATWDDADLVGVDDVARTLRSLPATPAVHRRDEGVEEALGAGRRLHASYEVPYQAHGSVAPSAAVAQLTDGRLQVWSATQGVHPLRRELAALLGRDAATITVHHVAGPGCYGQNATDDASAFAAIAATAVPGRPVRVQLSCADEFGWEPYGSAMAADLEASVDPHGRLLAWRHTTYTDGHIARPNGQGDRLVPAWLRSDGRRHAWVGASPGGGRNIVPPYDLPSVEAVANHVDGPLRTGSLRTLGAFFNVFASESFMDEVADAVGVDPLEFRLRHLHDQRARDVLEAVAAAADWQPRVGPSGRGRGVAFARYHDAMAYVAAVAEVHLDLEASQLSVERLWLAADAGTVVNVEGLRQQLEGGAVQAVSRTLRERLLVDRRGIRGRDWESYEVLRFRDVPMVHLTLIDRPGMAPLGAGEASTPPVAAAIANAIDDAAGIRLRKLPFTAEIIERTLLAMDDRDLERVLPT